MKKSIIECDLCKAISDIHPFVGWVHIQYSIHEPFPVDPFHISNYSLDFCCLDHLLTWAENQHDNHMLWEKIKNAPYG